MLMASRIAGGEYICFHILKALQEGKWRTGWDKRQGYMGKRNLENNKKVISVIWWLTGVLLGRKGIIPAFLSSPNRQKRQIRKPAHACQSKTGDSMDSQCPLSHHWSVPSQTVWTWEWRCGRIHVSEINFVSVTTGYYKVACWALCKNIAKNA